MLLYNTIVTEDKNFEKSTNEKKTEKKTDMDGGRTGRSFVSGTGRLFTQSLFPEKAIKWNKSGRVKRAETEG